jgi:predicted transcriptional regulator
MAGVSHKLPLVAKIAASYLRRNAISVDQIGALISSVGDALEQASKKTARTAADEAAEPAVSIKKSVQREYIVCLEDGSHWRTLKRHLRTAHGMTPQQYREKWRLPHDYPMTAPAYSERRSQLAKWAGLGRKAGAAKRGRTATNTASSQST